MGMVPGKPGIEVNPYAHTLERTLQEIEKAKRKNDEAFGKMARISRRQR